MGVPPVIIQFNGSVPMFHDKTIQLVGVPPFQETSMYQEPNSGESNGHTDRPPLGCRKGLTLKARGVLWGMPQHRFPNYDGG